MPNRRKKPEKSTSREEGNDTERKHRPQKMLNVSPALFALSVCDAAPASLRAIFPRSPLG